MKEKMSVFEKSSAGLIIPKSLREQMTIVGSYRATLLRGGKVIWEDEFPNLVVNVGKIDMLDKYFAGSAYTAALFMGLVNTAPTYNAADTMASHAGWTEVTGYSEATRPAVAWNGATASGGGSGSAGTGSKVSTATTFSINATVTVAGCFLTTISTKSGTTGTLFSAGSFTGGDRAAVSGDTINVTYTAQN